jgi:hypothetical protein
MDFSAVLGTIVGAVVGVGSTLLADRARWRRDHDLRQMLIRRETYSDFLAALSQAHTNLRTISLQEHPDGVVPPGLLAAGILESGIWRMRQSLSLCAPSPIIELAITACDAMVSIQDALIVNPDHKGAPYLRARAGLWAANANLREAMRKDLGVPGPSDPEVGKIL